MTKGILIFISLLLFAGIISCKRNHYRVNISSISVDLEIKRLEKDLFTIEPHELENSILSLKVKYDQSLQLFSHVINAGFITDSSFNDMLVRFCTDRLNNEVYEETVKVFPDISNIEKNLDNAFRHYRHYFPGKPVPALFTCITGFNSSIITGDSVLGIGLDRYLGADSRFYKQLGIYSYLSARMTPDHIIPDCMYAWGTSEWDFELMKYESDNVMTEMIHEGKLRYFTKCMLPDFSDELIFGFTPGQMIFCRNNEGRMWQYIIENDLFFSTDKFIIRKLVGEAPFTSYFTSESPGRAAVWVGFRIIESFMMKNPGITIEEMMKNSDIQWIVEMSKYNPK
jgi:hypothetical protein